MKACLETPHYCPKHQSLSLSHSTSITEIARNVVGHFSPSQSRYVIRSHPTPFLRIALSSRRQARQHNNPCNNPWSVIEIPRSCWVHFYEPYGDRLQESCQFRANLNQWQRAPSAVCTPLQVSSGACFHAAKGRTWIHLAVDLSGLLGQSPREKSGSSQEKGPF